MNSSWNHPKLSCTPLWWYEVQSATNQEEIQTQHRCIRRSIRSHVWINVKAAPGRAPAVKLNSHQTSIYCVGLKYPSTFKHCNNTDSYCVSLTSILFTMASFCVNTSSRVWEPIMVFRVVWANKNTAWRPFTTCITHMKGEKHNSTASTVKTWWQQKAGRGEETSVCRNK